MIGWRSWGGAGRGWDRGRERGRGEKEGGSLGCGLWVVWIVRIGWIGLDWIGLDGGGKRKGEGMDENGAKRDKERNLGRRDRKAENATIDGGSEISG